MKGNLGGLYVINPLYAQSCNKFATPHDKVGSKSSHTILVPLGESWLGVTLCRWILLTNKITTACQLISSQLSTIRRPHFW